MGAPLLEFRSVTRRFRRGAKGTHAGETVAIRDTSFAAHAGEVLSIIGPSGCGKSTLLNLAAGLDFPTSGEIEIEGCRVARPSPQVAFMLQKDLLLPWRTIEQNVEFGQEIQGVSKADRRIRAGELLAAYGLREFGSYYPHQLSGGMRQRAALARTMALDPALLLLDEPFSAVDAQTRMVLQRELATVLARHGKTAILITHDLAEAIILSDRVLIMSARPGSIVKEVVVELPDRDNPFARRQRPEVGRYVEELWGLLHIDERPPAMCA